MNEISKYFKEEWNKALFEGQNLDNQVQMIDNEMSKLEQQERDISIREDNPDYVFQVECFEKSMDEKSLQSIMERRSELECSRQKLIILIEENNRQVDKYRQLYNESIKCNFKSNNDNFCERIEFIIKLMDSDIQRAKIELTNLLKEEKRDAD